MADTQHWIVSYAMRGVACDNKSVKILWQERKQRHVLDYQGTQNRANRCISERKSILQHTPQAADSFS